MFLVYWLILFTLCLPYDQQVFPDLNCIEFYYLSLQGSKISNYIPTNPLYYKCTPHVQKICLVIYRICCYIWYRQVL